LTAGTLQIFNAGFAVALLRFPLLLTPKPEFLLAGAFIFGDLVSCVSCIARDKGIKPTDASDSFDVFIPMELLT
jgi:hypothetical protein